MIEWKSNDQMISHYKKHVLDKEEKTLWDVIPVISENDYENISTRSIYNSDSYLYKPKDTNYFSINYYNDDFGSTMITSTRKNYDEYKIYSCYLTKDGIKKYINIYLFVNSITSGNLKNFLKYERKNRIYDKYLTKAINYSNLDNIEYTDKQKEISLKMNILIEFLKDNDRLENGNDLLIHKQLKEKLLSKIKNMNFTISLDLYKVKNQINDMYDDSDIYEEYKDSIDLLVEIINYIYGKKEIKIKDNMWTNMFEDFNNIDFNH